MTYRERTKAFCAAVLLIAKNATIIIPIIEGIVYSIIDLVKPKKQDKEEIKDAEVSEK